MLVRHRCWLLSLGLLACVAAGSQQARAASSLRGTAVDAVRGVPLRNAQVLIASLDGKTEKETVTSAGGAFSFDGLPAGRYFVLVNHYSSAGAGSETLLRSRVIVSLEPDRAVEGLKLSPPPSYTIAGTVRDQEDDWPLADATVEALSAHYAGGARTYAVRGQAATDDLGQFRIRNLAPGSYYLRISRAPLPAVPLVAESKRTVRPRRVFEMVYYPGARTPAQASPVRVAPGTAVAQVDVRIRQVEPATINGQVCPVPGIDPQTVRVGLYPPDGSTQEVGALAKFPVNAQGDFRIEDLPPGTHLLCASSGEHPPAVADCATTDVDEKAQASVKLCPRPAGSVSGRVRLAGRRSGQMPLDGLEVYLNPQEGGPMAFSSGGGIAPQPDGRFTVTGLVAGRYQVATTPLSAPWYVESVMAEGVDVTAGSLQVSPDSAVQIEVVLADGGGVVEGALKGDAVPAGAQVVLIPEPALRRNPLRFYTAEASDDGRFRLEGVAPGSYTAVAVDGLGSQKYLDPEWIARYGFGGPMVTVQDGQRVPLDLTMATR